ncbi:MAG: phosphatase PAP2 family protein [Nitrososphaeraceae archaeon]
MDRLTLLSIIFLLSFLILSIYIVITQFESLSTTLDFDVLFLLQINQVSIFFPSIIDNFMLIITLYGREIFWPIVLIMLFIFGGKKGKKTALITGLVMILLIPIVSITKDLVERTRPNLEVTAFSLNTNTFSFPSGHATIVSAGAASVSVLFRGTTKRTILSIVLASEATLVCFSRIYLGVHYPLDVIGGILLGTGFSFFIIRLFNLLYPKLNFLNKKLG